MAEAAQAALTGDAERLGFRVGGALYAVPTSEVIEVLRPRPLARVPHAPVSLLGVANLRGSILPVVSAARLIGADASTEIGRSSRVLVLNHRPVCGLLVETVIGLIREPAQPFDVATLLAAAVTPSMTARRKLPGSNGAVTAQAATDEENVLAVLAFVVESQVYALPLDCVVEIMPVPGSLRVVADMDPAILGLVAQRGLLLPVISLGRLLGLGDENDRASLIVVKLADGDVALAVDEVHSILRLSREKIDAVPAVLTRGSGETRLTGIARGDDGALIAILSPDRLFDEVTQARLACCAEQSQRSATVEANGAMADALEQFVVLTMNDEHYGLPIASVEEVVRRPAKLSPLPRSPAFVLGVMNLRGQAVPVLDGGSRFGATSDTGVANRIVVVSMQGVRAGFAVDAVREIITLHASAIAPAPDFVRAEETGDAFRRIADHQGRLIFLVEPDSLLAKAERDALKASEDPKGRPKRREVAASAS